MKKRTTSMVFFLMIAVNLAIVSEISAATAITDSLFSQGNTFYMHRQYDRAEMNYKRLVDLGFESADLYYNLANSLYKQEKYAKAILYYEKALVMKPGDEDIKQNLALANMQIMDRIDAIPDFFLKRWLNAIRGMFSADGWALGGLILFVASLAAFAFYFTGSRRFTRNFAFVAGTVLLIFTVLSLAFMFSRVKTIRQHHNAIIMAPSVNARSSPDEQSTNVFVLHEGSRVVILDSIQNWKEIRIANGNKGWIPEESLEQI